MSSPVVLIRVHPLQTTLPAINNIPVSVQHDEKQLYDNAIRQLIRKLDRKLFPFLFVLEISSFINRVTIGMCFDCNHPSLMILS